MITIIKENTVSLKLDISEALTALGKTNNDITDVAFAIKKDFKDADVDALVYKTKIGGGITFSTPNYFVNLLPTDYSNITVGKVYDVAVGIKYTGITKFIELELDDGKLRVKQDAIRA